MGVLSDYMTWLIVKCRDRDADKTQWESYRSLVLPYVWHLCHTYGNRSLVCVTISTLQNTCVWYEWVMSHIRAMYEWVMSHVCMISERVISDVRIMSSCVMSHVRAIKERGMSYVRIRHTIRQYESSRRDDIDTSKHVCVVWMSHVTHTHDAGHSYKSYNEWIYIFSCLMCFMWRSRHFLTRVCDTNESYHTYEWVISHIWMSHITHMNDEWITSHIRRRQVEWETRRQVECKMNHTYVDAKLSHIRRRQVVTHT